MRLYVYIVLLVLVGPSAAWSQVERYFESNRVRIRYIEQGNGELVILVHGQGGSADGNEWGRSGVMAELARSYRVVAIDMRGHGKSDKPRDPKQYGREMALDVIRLMDHLGVKRAHVVGYSLGAVAVSHVFPQFPERFATVTLAGAAAPVTYSPEAIRLADEEAAERERDGISRTALERTRPTDAPPLSDDEFRRRSAAALADPTLDRFALAAQIRARRELVLDATKVAALPIPVLGIVGGADPLGKRLLEDFVRIKPTTKLVVIEGATHGVSAGPAGAAAFNQPQFIRALRDFLSMNAQRAH